MSISGSATIIPDLPTVYHHYVSPIDVFQLPVFGLCNDPLFVPSSVVFVNLYGLASDIDFFPSLSFLGFPILFALWGVSLFSLDIVLNSASPTLSSSFAFLYCLVRLFISVLNPCVSCYCLLGLLDDTSFFTYLILIVPKHSRPTAYTTADMDASFLCTSPVRVFSKILSRSSSKVSHRLPYAGGH